MKNRMAIAAVVLTALVATPIATAQQGLVIKAKGQPVEDSYIVVFNKGLKAKDLAPQLAAIHGGELRHVYSHVLQGAAYRMNARQAEAMARNPWVARVEEDSVFHVVGDQANPPSWGLDRVDQRNLPLNNNYHYDFTGAGVRVYVIDTGIRTTHNDFGGRAVWGKDCTGQGQSDATGHGTHVAGTIGGAAHGVAKSAGLYAVKVCTASGCDKSHILCGVDYVSAQKLANPSIPMVANMSLGGGFDQTLHDAVNNAVNKNVFYAIAAGNDNTNACNISPASSANAFTVGATTITDARRTSSNFGTCLDIFAPGENITSAWHTSNTAVQTISGTSMAAPHVAGAAALMLQPNPSWSPYQVTSEIAYRSTLNKVTSPGTGSPNRLLYTLAVPSPGGSPAMPASLTVTNGRCWAVNSASWPAVSGATYYELYSSTNSSYPSQTLVYSGANTSSAVFANSVTYLRVRACNASGCSTYRVGDGPAYYFNAC